MECNPGYSKPPRPVLAKKQKHASDKREQLRDLNSDAVRSCNFAEVVNESHGPDQQIDNRDHNDRNRP